MRFRGEGASSEIRMDLTPMIDCIFQLILFFLVTSAFIKLEQDLSIELPTHNREIKVKKPPARPIIVNARYMPGGKAYYHIENERMSLPAIAVNLSKARMRNNDQAVIIRGDKNVKWEHIAAVMGCCADAGISKVSATVEIQEGG